MSRRTLKDNAKIVGKIRAGQIAGGIRIIYSEDAGVEG
jgi:hypothetical protein